MSNENEDLTNAVPASETDDAAPAQKDMSRREAVQLLSVLPIAAALGLSRADYEKAWGFVDDAQTVAGEGVAFAPRFFTPAEFRTVGIVADMIIPRDDRSGSATDAGVPEFMDFIMTDRPNNQQWMRSGLAWTDAQSTTRFGKPFAGVSVPQREQILNDIAWPARASRHGRWRHVLQSIPRSHFVRLLVQPHGCERPSLHREHFQSELEWLSA